MKKKTKKWLILGVSIIVVIVIIVLVRGGAPEDEYSTITLEPGLFKQTVSEVGVVKPTKELSLNFLNTGRIGDVYVKVGDEVEKDMPLASLETESLELKKKEAEAGLRIAEANLSKTLAGASQETIRITYSELEQAKASERSARADLEQTKKSVAENIKQAEENLFDLESKAVENQTSQELAVESAEISLDNTKKSAQEKIDNTRSSLLLILDDKILVGKVALDNLNTILEDDDAENILGVKNLVTLNNTKKSRLDALKLLPDLEIAISKAKDTKLETDINEAVGLSKDFLVLINQSLTHAYSMLEATIITASFSQTKLDSYKTLVTSQSSGVSTALNSVESSSQAYSNAIVNYYTSLRSAEEALRQAQINLVNAISSAKNNLTTIKLSGEQQLISAQSRLSSAINSVALVQARLSSVTASARSQDVSLAQAQISQAKSALENIENQLEKSVITAPLKGVVTEVNYNVGEQFGGGGQPVIRLLADGNFEIEVDISESDINKIEIEDPVEITLDAFSDDFIIYGQVSFIEPAQTLIQGVVYYKVKISFNNIEAIQANLATQGSALKSGMTANIVITTEIKEDTLAIPARAVIDKDGIKIVRILENGELVEIPVRTGLRGDDGLIEIKEGLKSGNEVITFIKSAK